MTIMIIGTTIMDDFLWRALSAGLGVALVAGPLGCFVVWRRMAYFGDTLAHSALLGVALGFFLHLNLTLGIVITSVAIALLLILGQGRQTLSIDTLLGILSHSALALGLVLTAFMTDLRIDLMSYLFGDVLAVTYSDLAWIWFGGLAVLVGLFLLWRPLLSMTVHAELAAVEGVRTRLVAAAFMLLLAVVVTIALKVIGIVLVTALLIIPAAAARRLARSPEQMALLATLAGAVAVTAGLAGSVQWDTPAGPSIVVAAGLLFLLASVVPIKFMQRR